MPRLLTIATLFGACAWTPAALAGLVFDNGFEAGADDWLLSSSPWRPVPANAAADATVAREGAKSVHFLPLAGSKRSEFTLRNGRGNYAWGTEYWVGFSVRILRPTLGNGIICQQHAVPHANAKTGETDWNTVAGANSFTLRTDADGHFVIHTATDPAMVSVVPAKGDATLGTVNVVRPYALNVWYDFVLHFRLAPDRTGIMEVWMTNASTGATEKLVDVHDAPTVYRYDVAGLPKARLSYQKIGLYYGPHRESIGGELLYDAFRIWEGPGGHYADVAPGERRPSAAPHR